MPPGPTEVSIRESVGAQQGGGNQPELFIYLISRTDPSGNHLNGQGEFGFCSSDCANDNNNSNNNNNVGQRINLVVAPETNNDAVVFANDEDAGIILPPS